jgi:alkanesulfonate monooxygenase SsuD/methylene tetrahydromethanopterin reductase-like flavin-dependent oxidoreductase (luciferase family)
MKLSLASLGAEPGARFLEQVKLAELLGFHGYCHDDRRSARELFSRLGAATQVTTRLGLAAGVIDPTTRHPALIAQAAATLAELAPRRFRDPTPAEIKRAVSVAVWSIRKVLGEIIDQLAPYASYEFKAFIRDAPAEASAPVVDELRRLLPPAVIDCLAVVGTAPQLVERLKALAAAGMQEVVLCVVPAPGQDMIDVMYKLAQEVLPHFSERATRPS